MRIIPVIDLKQGVVVRGVGGRRSEYQPIQSVLAVDARPATVARAFAERGLREVYVADLDAIGGAPPAVGIYDELLGCGLNLLVDAGLGDFEQTRRLAKQAVIVAGLESLVGWDRLAQLVEAIGPERLVFSLDLKQGQPLTANDAWRELAPMYIAEMAVEAGITRLIVLDLAQVGMGSGVGTEGLCRQLRQRFPQIELIAGGGVRSQADLDSLTACGCDGALVASALHDGRIRI